MLRVITEKDLKDGLHYVVKYEVIPKNKQVINNTIPNVHFIYEDKLSPGFYKEYWKFFIDAGYVRKNPVR